MTDTSYNGWTNRETWCVALWIGNDQGMYYTAREFATETAEEIDAEFDANDAKYRLADQLKDWVEDTAEIVCPGVIEGASFISDLFGYALAQVDWYEIAEHQLEDALESISQ